MTNRFGCRRVSSSRSTSFECVWSPSSDQNTRTTDKTKKCLCLNNQYLILFLHTKSSQIRWVYSTGILRLIFVRCWSVIGIIFRSWLVMSCKIENKTYKFSFCNSDVKNRLFWWISTFAIHFRTQYDGIFGIYTDILVRSDGSLMGIRW